jgi:hypothetical protein
MDIGIRVSTKKLSVGFSGGAIKPSMTTVCPSSDFNLSDSVRPRGETALYISPKLIAAGAPARGLAGADMQSAMRRTETYPLIPYLKRRGGQAASLAGKCKFKLKKFKLKFTSRPLASRQAAPTSS